MVRIECVDCTWHEEFEPTDNIPFYCEECGEETETVRENTVDNLSDVETKSDKV